MDRYTYRSSMGDYGSAVNWESDRQEIYALRNKLGKYEDNEWKSVRNDGNPGVKGEYEITVFDSETMNRYVSMDCYDPNDMFGFSVNRIIGLKVLAWRNLEEPYMGE